METFMPNNPHGLDYFIHWSPFKNVLSLKILANHIQQYVKKIICHDQVGFIMGCKDGSVFPYQSTCEGYKSYIYLNRCIKGIWQNSTSVHDKNSQKGGIRGNIPQCNKGLIWQSHRSHYIQWWKNESFSPNIRNETKMSILPLLFNTLLEVLAKTDKKQKQKNKKSKKQVRGIQIVKEEKLSLFSDDMILYKKIPWRLHQKPIGINKCIH